MRKRSPNKKKVFITGASGFIGGFLVEEALKRNYEVYAAIRSSSSKKYLEDERIKFLEIDFSDREKLTGQFRNLFRQGIEVSYIIHNAGITKAKSGREYFKVNYEYTKNLLEALKMAVISPCKFIYISSLAAFGPGDEDVKKPIGLHNIPKPVTSYGKSKLEAERYIFSQVDFPFIILRPTAVYGPREKGLFALFKLIKNHLEVYIGFKKQHLSFIYVKDLARAVFNALESDIVNRAYFLSDGHHYDARIFSNTIKKKLQAKTLKVKVPVNMARAVAFALEKTSGIFGRPSAFNVEKVNELKSTNWLCEAQPFNEDMNFRAEYDLTSGISETVDWYRKENWL